MALAACMRPSLPAEAGTPILRPALPSSSSLSTQVLVIDQGTILDRIDYNIEQAADRVTSAVVELNKANEYDRDASWTPELPDLGLSDCAVS